MRILLGLLLGHSVVSFTLDSTSSRIQTILYTKRRFSQQQNADKAPTTRRSSTPSIEELEAKLAQRWGNDLSVWTSQDVDDDDDDDDEDAEIIEQAPKFRGKPVPEFYDHDDEGYEDSSEKWNLRRLIAPEPAGGQGTFNMKQKKQKVEPVTVQTSEPPTITSTKETDKPPAAPIQQAQPLLDDNNQPLFLTLEQAKRNFKGQVDDTPAAPTTTTSWQEHEITHSTLLQNLQTMNCPKPLSVQQQTIKSILQRQDVLVGTYTGSGKTLAFLVPLAQQLLQNPSKDLQVLIVAPGRELASQIVSVARELLEGTPITVMLAIGGTTFARNLEQIRKRKPNIIVGTPGRIAELVVGQPGQKTGRLKTGHLQTLVLDEFDALLKYKPHRDPTHAILKTLQHNRLQSILCSATASDMLSNSQIDQYLRPGFAIAQADPNDALVVSGGPNETRVSRTVIHGVVHVPQRRLALETLRRILHTEPVPQQILIFVENSRKVKLVVEKLAGMGIIAAPLHGGMGSEKTDRAEVSKALREGYVGLVVATELAARGLDAPLLTHVINFDLPTDASHYAHRAGRCGRGGRPGVVINFTTDPKERNVPKRFAENLGIDLYTVEARGGKLNIVDPDTVSF